MAFLVPSVLATKKSEEISPKVCELGDMYAVDLPHRGSLQSEFHCSHAKWVQHEKEHISSLPKSPSFTLPHASSIFPNIRILLVIICTLPVTSCSSERSFSGLKRVKSALGSTMGNEQLSSLSLLYLHKDIDISIPEIIDEFSRGHPRCLQLGDILSAD